MAAGSRAQHVFRHGIQERERLRLTGPRPGEFWIQNDDFWIQNDEFWIQNDEFCSQNDELNANVTRLSRGMRCHSRSSSCVHPAFPTATRGSGPSVGSVSVGLLARGRNPWVLDLSSPGSSNRLQIAFKSPSDCLQIAFKSRGRRPLAGMDIMLTERSRVVTGMEPGQFSQHNAAVLRRQAHQPYTGVDPSSACMYFQAGVNFVLKTRNCVSKMMNFAALAGAACISNQV